MVLRWSAHLHLPILPFSSSSSSFSSSLLTPTKSLEICECLAIIMNNAILYSINSSVNTGGYEFSVFIEYRAGKVDIDGGWWQMTPWDTQIQTPVPVLPPPMTENFEWWCARKINENINKIELFDDLPRAIHQYHRIYLYIVFYKDSSHPLNNVAFTQDIEWKLSVDRIVFCFSNIPHQFRICGWHKITTSALVCLELDWGDVLKH